MTTVTRGAPVFVAGSCPGPVRSFRQSAWNGLKDGSVKVDSTNGPQRQWRLRGIDVKALEKAADFLLQLHPVLGQRIEERDGQPWLVPGASSPPIAVFDFCDAPDADKLGMASDAIGATVWTPFDIATGPLWRIYALRLAPGQYYLGIVIHHFICDYTAVDVIMNDLCRAHDAAVAGCRLELRDKPLSYGDYLSTFNDWFESETGQAQRRYWLKRLSTLPDLEIPDAVGPAGRREYFTFNAELTKLIQMCARMLATTPFVILLAVQALFLSRYTPGGEVALKVVTAGREVSPLRRVVGNLADRLYVLTDLAGNPTFSEAVRRTHAAVLESRKYSAVRFDIVQADLAAAGHKLSAPVFNFHPSGVSRAAQSPPSQLRPRVPPPPEFTRPGSATSTYWLEIHDQGHVMGGHVRYAAARIADFPQILQLLAGHACSDPAQNLSAILAKTVDMEMV
jgi:hypothetical protein